MSWMSDLQVGPCRSSIAARNAMALAAVDGSHAQSAVAPGYPASRPSNRRVVDREPYGAEEGMELGQKVTAPGHLIRRTRDGRKTWVRPEWKQIPTIGIYIGVRTYQNGTRQWEGTDEGMSWTPDEYLKVALIVENQRHRPVPVLYSEMMPVD